MAAIRRHIKRMTKFLITKEPATIIGNPAIAVKTPIRNATM
jgi:hypothetical protein